MASQVVASSVLDSVEICSYIRGYYDYKDIWDPVVGQQLLLKQELSNPKDVHAVEEQDEVVVIRHIPYHIAPTVSVI